MEEKPKTNLGRIPLSGRWRASSAAKNAQEAADQLIIETATKSAALEVACARAGEVRVALAEARMQAERLSPEQAKPILEKVDLAAARLARELGDVCPMPSQAKKARKEA